MQAVILCGGKGERLMPMTAKTPAPLLRINCKEILLYTIEQLKKSGIDRITLATGYESSQIKDFVSGRNFQDVEIEFSENGIENTWGALSKAADKSADNFLVLNGNCVFDCGIEELLFFHCKKSALCTAFVRKGSKNGKKSFVGMDKNGKIVSYISTPTADIRGCDLCEDGIFVMSTKIFEKYSFPEELDFTQSVIPELIRKSDEFYGMENKGHCRHIVTAEDFLECQEFLLDTNEEPYFSETKDNFNGCTIEEPVRIGKNVTIEPGTVIGKGTVIDDGAIIKSKCRISGAYIGKNAVVSHRCSIEKSVICANGFLDRYVRCESFSVVGESSSIGENSTICEGASVWAQRNIPKNSTVRENIIKQTEFIRHIDENGDYILSNQYIDAAKTTMIGQALGTALDSGDIVVIGHSERENTRVISDCVKNGAMCSGAVVCDIGECTLPQLIFALNRTNGKLCVFSDSLSHSKLTILSSGGMPIDRKTEAAFECAAFKGSYRHKNTQEMCKAFDLDSEKLFYEEYLNDILPEIFDNFNVEIRTSSRIIAQISDRLFRKRNDIDSSDSDKIIFHISCDGKKCSAYSEKAGNISWEKLVCICCDSAFERGTSVALPYAFPTAADNIAEKRGGSLYRYKELYFADSNRQVKNIASSNENLFTADGLALACEICRILYVKNISLTDLLKEIPPIFTSERFISTDLDGSVIAKTLGFESSNREGSSSKSGANFRTIIRPLKNGGGINIFAEAAGWETAASLCDEITEKIKKMENGVEP